MSDDLYEWKDLYNKGLIPEKSEKLKPGYWVAWCRWYDSYEVVLVSSNCDTFNVMGYDLATSVLSEDWKFIKPFDLEDIVLNKELTND